MQYCTSNSTNSQYNFSEMESKVEMFRLYKELKEIMESTANKSQEYRNTEMSKIQT